MQPLIGISPNFNEKGEYFLDSKYISRLKALGASTIILPYDVESIPMYLSMISGLLLSGGMDIQASHYGETPHEKSDTPNLARDEFELAICREALNADMPILGICRGSQLLNVVLGGNLEQHFENHNFGDEDSGKYIHPIKIEPGSKLHTIIGSSEIEINSVHHQSAGNRLGDGVSICAVSHDGIPEAVEVASKKFVLGLQWHPELLNDAHNEAIFRAFIAACR
jgi:gamma-glutamyl-gamma-aminobutyrate hydrolase PuuD